MKKLLIILMLSLTLPLRAQLGVIGIYSPMDNGELPVSIPVFSWSSISSPVAGKTVHYEIKLVQILSGQSKTVAVQSNTPLFSDEFTTTFMSYPVSATELLACNHYAWQVKAFIYQSVPAGEGSINEKVYIGISEVRSFSLECEPEEPEPIDYAYIVLSKDNSEPYVFLIEEQQPTINISWKESYDSSQSTIQIYRYDIEVNSPESLTGSGSNSDSLQIDTSESAGIIHLLPANYYLNGVRKGSNFIAIPRSVFIDEPEIAEIYFLEVRNIRGEIYRAKIEFE